MGKRILFSGKTNFYEKETYYDFDGKKIYLYVDKKTYDYLTLEEVRKGVYNLKHKQLNVYKLIGSINGSTKEIIFLFDNIFSKATTHNFQTYIIEILIKDYLEFDSSNICDIKNSNFNMIFYSKDFYKFLNLTPIYNVNDLRKEHSPLATVTINDDNCNKKSFGKILGYDIELAPVYECRWGGSNFELTPGIKLIIKNASTVDYDDIMKFYHGVIKMIKYLFMRGNIYPTNVKFQYLNRKGEIFSNRYLIENEETENPNDIYMGFIRWEDCYEIIAEVLRNIIDENCLLNNIPNTKIGRLFVNATMIFKDAAEFEYEFKKMLPNGIPHREKRLKIEEEIRMELLELKDKSSGIKKGYYKVFLNHIKQESLKENIKFVLKQYDDFIIDIIKKLHVKISYETIASECAGIRNTVDHGKNDKKIDQTISLSYLLLRMVVYAMQLKRFGMKDENIKSSLINLLEIKEMGIL